MVKKKTRVHFMGIGGSALAGVAILAQKMGYEVSGCDLAKETYYSRSLRRAGIAPLFGHSRNHLKNADLVVVSPAILIVNARHPEAIEARERKVLMTWQEFVGRRLQDRKSVV